MEPDQAREGSHADQDRTEGEQEGKGEAHDGPVRYDGVVPEFTHRSGSALLGKD